MAVTSSQAEGQDVKDVKAAPTRARKDAKKTTLDDDVTMPGYVAPGDGPFDTVDATEIATSVSPDKANAARQGFGVVNAVLPLERIPGSLTPEEVRKHNGTDDGNGERVETYEVPGPDGKPVKVTHNIDTGETQAG